MQSAILEQSGKLIKTENPLSADTFHAGLVTKSIILRSQIQLSRAKNHKKSEGSKNQKCGVDPLHICRD